MRLRTVFSLLLIGALHSPAHAQHFDANISNESVAFAVTGALRAPMFAGALYDLGFIYRDDTRNNTLGNLGLSKEVARNVGLPGLRVGVSGRLFIGDVRSADVSAIAPGIAIDYAPAIAPRITASMLADYAPSVIAFNDAKKLVRFETRFSYEVIDDTHVYLGYRDMETKLNNSRTFHIDNGWMLGVSLPL